MFFRVI